jgi:diadenylate cyclase
MLYWFLDIVDVILLAFIIYQVLLIFQRTRVTQVLRGLLIFALIILVAHIFELRASRFIFDSLIIIIPIALLIIFQPELRSLFEGAGRRGLLFSNIKRLAKEDVKRILEEVVTAMENMAEKRIGSLIVIEGEQSLQDYVETGETVDAALKPETLETIFYPYTPLHDGAVVLRGDRILAARCFLPLSENTTIPSHLGTRHRAALGVTELTDSISLIVSEETGRLSLCYGGKLAYNLTPQALKTLLRSIIYPEASSASVLPTEQQKKKAEEEKLAEPDADEAAAASKPVKGGDDK